MKLTAVKWLPWRFLLRTLARSHGFIDPFYVIGALSHFNQPSEVAEPIELLRAGVIMHARGLINTKAIQHNLDWVWPFWVERQFDPADGAFLPRSFSITHVNLTHRNWTAVGIPGFELFPLVGPGGLVTPHFDGWSLDWWMRSGEGEMLLPSKESVSQVLHIGDLLCVETSVELPGWSLKSTAQALLENGLPVLRLEASAVSAAAGTLVMAMRPYNAEGISFIHRIETQKGRSECLVNREHTIIFRDVPDRFAFSNYREGDVLHCLGRDSDGTACKVGMASGAAIYSLSPGEQRKVKVDIPLSPFPEAPRRRTSWKSRLNELCRFNLPVGNWPLLFDSSLTTLLLLTPKDVYPGPYTYKRFWFRDAAFLLHALLCQGAVEEVREAISRFPARQKLNGYFHSQEGEWDSNGQVLWLLGRHAEMTMRPPSTEWMSIIEKAALWISQKRLRGTKGTRHDGLLPAGFSAEHLGPNDYYYWDDFFGVAGLESAASLAGMAGDTGHASQWKAEAVDFRNDLMKSIREAEKPPNKGIPASPYRRMDAGAVGSITGAYPLDVMEADDERVRGTVDYLLKNCFFHWGFFQHITHSGINVYLSLQIAQLLLMQGDPRYLDIIHAAADLASPTGQWPEAIHPRTLGGCMGDGQHGWASAEWLMMMRSLFVREKKNSLVLGAGIQREWLDRAGEISYGPALTRFGPVTVKIRNSSGNIHLEWEARWHNPPELVHAGLFGTRSISVGPDCREVVMESSSQ